MIGVRTLARPLLAGMFVMGGIEALRRPSDLAPAADDLADTTAELTGVEAGPNALVQANGAVQLTGGVLLATGILPRWAALALAGTLVPTTLAAHRFWEREGDDRTREMTHFLQNAGLFGGLLFAALDTGGRPSVFWSARRAMSGAADAVGAGASKALDSVG